MSTNCCELSVHELLRYAPLFIVPQIVLGGESATRVEMESTPVSAIIHLMSHPAAGIEQGFASFRQIQK